MNEDGEALKTWLKRAKHWSVAHYKASRDNSIADLAFTFANIMLPIGLLAVSLYSGTSPNTSTQPQPVPQWVFPLISTFAVIIGIIQFIVDGRARAIYFARAGAEYAAIVRQIEQLLDKNADTSEISAIRENLDKLAKGAPLLRWSAWKKDIVETDEEDTPSSTTPTPGKPLD